MWLVVLYFVAIKKNFEVKILLLNRALRYFCFKLVGKCQLLFIFLPNINSHLGVKDSHLGVKDSHLGVNDSNLSVKDSNLGVKDSSLVLSILIHTLN